MQPEGDTSDPPSDNPATSSDDAAEQAAFELDQHAPSDQLASPDDDVESSRASSDWTSTVDGSADIGLNAPAGDLQQLPELSDSDAADDELETTDDDDSSSAGSADLAHELEHFVRRFERISIGGFDDHEQQQYLVMLTYELERDVKDPPAKPGCVSRVFARVVARGTNPFFLSSHRLTGLPLPSSLRSPPQPGRLSVSLSLAHQLP